MMSKPRHLLLGLGERAVGDQHLAVAHPHRRGVASAAAAGRRSAARPRPSPVPVSPPVSRLPGSRPGPAALSDRPSRSRDRNRANPATITTSPTLKTLCTGSQDGVANTSPRNCERGSATSAQFAKCPGAGCHPEASSAPRVAGMVPPFAAIAVRLEAPPTPTTQRADRPVVQRRRTRPRARRWPGARPRSGRAASGRKEITTTWSARASHTSQVCRSACGPAAQVAAGQHREDGRQERGRRTG